MDAKYAKAGKEPRFSRVQVVRVPEFGTMNDCDAPRGPADRRITGDARSWWSDAVFYQIYPRSFADSNGDGVGDLGGIRDKLGYLELLGVDALWLSPVTKSPMADHGYDVSDPRDIDPLFGTIETMDAPRDRGSLARHHVTMDLVPNHTSEQHVWFQAALASPAGSAERARYIFRDGRDGGESPPNNWPSIFGGPAWTRIIEADGTPGQWYLHIFAAEQPDLNWDNPEVFDDLGKHDAVLAATAASTDSASTSPTVWPSPTGLAGHGSGAQRLLRNDDDDPRFNNDGVHDIHRAIRTVIDEYPGAMTVGEIWVQNNARFGDYVRPDELSSDSTSGWPKPRSMPTSIRDAVDNSLDAVDRVGGDPDVDPVEPRHRTRGHAIRRRRDRRPARASDGVGHARASGSCVPLQRFRAWSAERRPPRRCVDRIRSGSAPATPSGAETAAAFRCRGKVPNRPSASRRQRTPGYRCRPSGPRAPSRVSSRTSTRPSACTAQPSNCVPPGPNSCPADSIGTGAHPDVSRSGAAVG